MDPAEAEELAHELMAEFGLHEAGWRFAWNRRKASFGLCRWASRTVELSAPLVEVNDVDLIEDTIRHEIAHALAGRDAAHGPHWRAACEITWAHPRACAQGVGLPARWAGVCPNDDCEVVITRHRLTQAMRAAACARCCREANGYDLRFRLLWIDTTLAGEAGPGAPGATAVAPVPTTTTPAPVERTRPAAGGRWRRVRWPWPSTTG
jgi:predicted SprT family Zn-dependent metalloprotease